MLLENKRDWIDLSLLWGKIAQLGCVLSNTKYVAEARKMSLIPAEGDSELLACFEC